jgi:hypothetical protein
VKESGDRSPTVTQPQDLIQCPHAIIDAPTLYLEPPLGCLA